ncbi:MAG TPA: hypothetical protein ENJ36_00690, partial [Candidatus Bathyarchaeota archaeon]|nr:hypothetical protein [Candidatus Bathyarchaeota archaeon]
MTDEYKVEEGIYYTKEHEWAKKLDDGMVAVGIDDFAQAQLHEIVYVELPEMDAEVSQGEAIGAVESVKAVSDMYCPVGGKVVEVNEELQSTIAEQRLKAEGMSEESVRRQGLTDKYWLIDRLV